jgi:pathogenesis-related protein 1
MQRLFILFLIFGQPILAQSTITSTGSDLKTGDATAILTHHNTIRKEKGVAALSWSISLSAYAQKWADYLAQKNNGNIRHRDVCGENGQSYGENIFWGSSAIAYPPLQASISWYQEKELYSYRAINNSNWIKTGHYTQMMWKDTREMGVGISICANGAIIVVANYYPAGNVIGQYPY